VIPLGKLTGGSKFTQELAGSHGRPCLHIDVHEIPQFLAATEINRWVIENGIEVLNVAGPRASKDPKIYGDTRRIIESALLLSIMQADPTEHIRDYAKESCLEKLPVPPRIVDDAVDQLIRRMSIRDRAVIADMGIDELLELHKSLGRYIRDTFQLPDNDELMASCREMAKELVMDEDHAGAVMIGGLRQEPYRSHRLGVVE